MGKRSDFQRAERDFYPTPLAAVYPLLPHLTYPPYFIEPCCGDGHLKINLIRLAGAFCVDAFDIAHGKYKQQLADARTAKYDLRFPETIFITNPPWSREILHPIIANLSNQAPTWLLLDADWMHTWQAAEYLPRCRKIVSVGRVKWIEDSDSTGKDNACWYLFDVRNDQLTTFHGRPHEDPTQTALSDLLG